MALGDMEKRKVQLTGTSTLTISLPKAWVVRNGVAPRDEVFVIEEPDGSLSLSLRPAAERLRSAEISAEKFAEPSHLARAFLAKYLAGYKTVRILSSGKIPQATRAAIVAQVDRLIGFEITEETANSITAQDFFSHEGLSIEKTLRRAHLIARGMHVDAVDALLKHDAELADAVIARDDEADRLRFLIVRQLSLALNHSALLQAFGITAYDSVIFLRAARCLEDMADQATQIAAHSRSFKGKLPPDVARGIESLSAAALDAHTAAFGALFTKNMDAANSVIAKRAELEAKREALEMALQKKGAPFQIGFIIEAIMRIYAHSTHIAEAVIDRE